MLKTRTTYGSRSETAPETTTPATENARLDQGRDLEHSAPEPGVTPVTSLIAQIRDFNQGREPERLQCKYTRMRADLFSFFRGTPHLFYQDWPQKTELNQTPAVWVTGDLHLENFGSHAADNRLVYFDISDFDEGALAPVSWDLARFATSVLVSARSLGVHAREATSMIHLFLRSYTATLKGGKAKWVERQTAKGIVKDLITDLRSRSRKKLLEDRTELNGRARRLRIDRKRTLPVQEVARARIAALMKRWAARQRDPSFFKLLDVARRVTGVSHLGLPRYVLLVEGDGSPNENFLLDLKQAGESVLTPYLTLEQPEWKNHAERVVGIQQRMQAVTPALLQTVLLNRQPYVLKELQPSADRLSVDLWSGKSRRLEKVVTTAGELVASAQLRSSGRQGSVTADDLIAFGRGDSWQQELVAYARFYASKVESDYQEYCKGYDAGELED
jgi:uncharacterized protein (DUF2252 family)